MDPTNGVFWKQWEVIKGFLGILGLQFETVDILIYHFFLIASIFWQENCTSSMQISIVFDILSFPQSYMQDQNLEQMKGTSSFWLVLSMKCILDLTLFCHSKEHKYYWRKQTSDVLQNCINIFHITLCICNSWSSSTAALMLLLPYGWSCAFIYPGSVVQQTREKKIGIIFSAYKEWNKDM